MWKMVWPPKSLHTTTPNSSQRSEQRQCRDKALKSVKRWISIFRHQSSCKSWLRHIRQEYLNRQTRPLHMSSRLHDWQAIRIQGKQRLKWCLPCIRFEFRIPKRPREAFLCVEVWKHLREPVSNRILLGHLLHYRFGCTWKKNFEISRLFVFVLICQNRPMQQLTFAKTCLFL